MSEVRCPAGHFLGHQKELTPYGVTITARVEFIGKEGSQRVYKASRRKPVRPFDGKRTRGAGEITTIEPPSVVICGNKGCGRRVTISAR